MMVVTMTMVAVAVVAVVAVVAMTVVMMMVVMSVPRFLVELHHSDALPNNHGARRRPSDDYRWRGSQLADDNGGWRSFVNFRFSLPGLNGVVAVPDRVDDSYFASHTLDATRINRVTVHGRCPITVTGAG
jgi:hypothetical protein